MSANDSQIGGEHYHTDYQHWDFITLYGLGYLEGCATKYITRWRKKGGLQDLSKAMHYLQKLREVATEGRMEPPAHAPRNEVRRFCTTNGLTGEESALIWRIVSWNRPDDLLEAERGLAELLSKAAKEGEGDG